MPRIFSANSFFALIFVATLGPLQVVAATDFVETLKLPVPKRFDLSHVQSEHYAAALGKDPARIFAFVRDQVSYETYIGCLRGPRGTLLAMAGNSVDQAALLASLLRESGQTVQYARGKLSPADARKLVETMWVERPRVTKADDTTKPSPELQATLDTLTKGVKRDYELIRDHLKKAGHKPNADAVISLDTLVEETQDHWWVQWKQGDRWVDLDPSFSDAAVESQYATVQGRPVSSLPENIFHRVEMRIKLEEYAILLQGNAVVTPTSREILNYTAKAADLSGTDIVLSHQPENWTGPATSIQGAIASAIKKTGRVKPILLLSGDKWMAGEAFYQRPPPSAGLSSVFTMMSGTGTRKPVPIATAAYLEFEFVGPDSQRDKVSRELLDLIGPGRRAERREFAGEEIRQRIESPQAVDLTKAVYNIFITTGAIHDAVSTQPSKSDGKSENKDIDVAQVLRAFNITLTAASDVLADAIGEQENPPIRSYPTSPRVQIAEIGVVAGQPAISLDQRRNSVRTLSTAENRRQVYLARVLRGVVDGTLERVLLDYMTTDAREIMSTSSVFEQLGQTTVGIVVLSGADAEVPVGIPWDARTRIKSHLQAGYLIVSPARAVPLGGRPRIGWWRINKKSGETVGVTDTGLYSSSTEYVIHKDKQGTYHVWYRSSWPPDHRYVGSFEKGTEAFAQFVRSITENPSQWITWVGYLN